MSAQKRVSLWGRAKEYVRAPRSVHSWELHSVLELALRLEQTREQMWALRWVLLWESE